MITAYLLTNMMVTSQFMLDLNKSLEVQFSEKGLSIKDWSVFDRDDEYIIFESKLQTSENAYHKDKEICGEHRDSKYW